MLGQALVDAASKKANNRQMLEQHPLLLGGQCGLSRRLWRVTAGNRPAPHRPQLSGCRCFHGHPFFLEPD